MNRRAPLGERTESDPASMQARQGPAGLKHWRYDLLEGLVVSFVSLALSSGITTASGAPPIYGIISSIVAGLFFPFVGGFFVTIEGPAAGLAPALVVTMPAHVFAVGLGIVLAWAVGLGESLLISVPANPLSGLQMPAFATLFQSTDLWKPAAIGFLTLTLIDGVESLATAQAVDRIDPFKRKSQPNKVLRAMGISNVVSSLVGGLTIIPGGVKSKTCIEAGGRTLWANFANAGFLLCFLFVAPGLVSLMPRAALGAVLVFTGWKMVHPKIVRHLGGVGREQVVFYGVTVVATLLTDLLIGVLAGTAVKLAYVVARSGGSARGMSLVQRITAPFRDPVTSAEMDGTTLILTVDRPLVCFNAYKLMERLEQRSEQVDGAVVQFRSGVTLVDHTAAESVFAALDDATPRPLRLEGFEGLEPLSDHPSAVRIRDLDEALNLTGG